MDHSKKQSIVDHVLSGALLAASLAIPATSFADTRAGGETTNANIALNNIVDEGTDNWEVLRSEVFNLTTTSNIVVTACSDVDNPGGAIPNTYRFTFGLNTTIPGLDTGAERTVDELWNDPSHDDPESVHVCSTRFFLDVPPGANTIHWLGSKANAAMANTTVLDISMTLVAVDGSQL